METNIFAGDEFNEFLEQLLAENSLEPKESGITKLVIDKGYEVLSDKQRYVFDKAIGERTYDECQRCGLEIPWSEMIDAEFNGGMCGYCNHMHDKE